MVAKKTIREVVWNGLSEAMTHSIPLLISTYIYIYIYKYTHVHTYYIQYRYTILYNVLCMRMHNAYTVIVYTYT